MSNEINFVDVQQGMHRYNKKHGNSSGNLEVRIYADGSGSFTIRDKPVRHFSSMEDALDWLNEQTMPTLVDVAKALATYNAKHDTRLTFSLQFDMSGRFYSLYDGTIYVFDDVQSGFEWLLSQIND